MEIKLTIPTEKKQGIIDAFCSVYGYQTEIDGGEGMVPNPQTQGEFAKEQIMKFVKDVYVSYKAKETDSARKTAIITAKTYTEDLTIA